MKNIIKPLIIVSAVLIVVAIFSQLSGAPLAGIKTRAVAGAAALLLLLAIALEGLK